MLRIIAFLITLLVVSAYALRRGGHPERYAAIMFIIAYVLSFGAVYVSGNFHYNRAELGMFGVDLLLSVALIWLALRANRMWPIWAASFQIVGVMAHLAKMVVPEILAPAYAIALVIWSYTLIPVLAVGTYRHRKRLREYGTDPSWSPR